MPWLGSTLQTADAALLVVDLGEPACTEQLQAIHPMLAARRGTLTWRWPAADESHAGE